MSIASPLSLSENYVYTNLFTPSFESNHYEQALSLASNFGLAAFDSLHLNAALISSCDEFITTERPTSPLFRVPGIRIITLSPPVVR